MKRKLLTIALCSLLPAAALAERQEAMFVPEFAGGLDINKVVSCETKYKKNCPLGNGRTMGQRLAQQSLCTAKKMLQDNECIQASRLRELSTEPPTKLRKYGDVSVFDVTTFSDGSENFYMVDRNGLFIALTTHLNMEHHPAFLNLRKKHKNLGLTGYLRWTKPGQNLFPRAFKLPNNNHRLVFRQELRYDYFVPGSTVGVAEVAYDFDPKGRYLGASVLKVEEV